ncbi:MAG TPA: FtsQ-type POTRA domain-containing protein [Bryobacteraceae bacterium]|nr:FtsQ-type POTRA domain-containing protein [Bryobacteraceae bacterium]
MFSADDAGPVVDDRMSAEPRSEDTAATRVRSRSKRTTPPKSAVAILRWFARLTVVAVMLVSSLWGFERLERFLIHDPRFVLAEPSEDASGSPDFHIEGLQYASKAKVLRVFAVDFDRSVYLMPLEERRRELLAVDWVKDAVISRIWPNQVTVRIVERHPVAFVTVAMEGGISQTALIDPDGVILQTPPKSRFMLPVLTGVKAGDSRESRKARVRRMQRFLQEVGPLGDKISEIDVTDRDNLKVTVQENARALVLLLGDHDFAQRLRNFMSHHAEIQRRLPRAATLDLRLEDRITVVE